MVNFERILILFFISFLSACTTVREESNYHPEGAYEEEYSSFHYFLYEGYLKLAKQENNENDFADQDLFTKKAARAEEGRVVNPQQLNMRRIPEHAREELTQARKKLIHALSYGGRDLFPRQAANAQVMFDCWMQEQEEDLQSHDINVCKKGLNKALMAMNLPAKKSITQSNSVFNKSNDCYCNKNDNEDNKVLAKLPPPFIIYFDFDIDELDAKAIEVIKKIKAAYEKFNPKQVIVTAHTDLAGKNGYNDNLSSRRMRNVFSGLILAGIPKNVINESYYGETHPAIVTQNGQRKAANRRVEITLTYGRK